MTRAIAEFLAQAARRDVRFERTLTIGRQNTFVGPRRLRGVLRNHGPFGAHDRQMRFEEAPWTIEPFLSALGAREVLAMDSSDYEGAQIIHDLNQPVPEDLHGRFTLLFDGGSLEHVFNVPAAIASYMELVEVGGHIIITTAGNNFLGHGMYQFSPEFFYRVFSRDNGFEIERLVAMENYVVFQPFLGGSIPYELYGHWYDVSDPAVVGRRVELQNSRPVVLALQARRLQHVVPLSLPVHQSDYAATWRSSETRGGTGGAADQDKPSDLSRRAEAYARMHLTVTARMTLALDVLPRTLPFLNPFWLAREPRTRSFANRAAYRPVRGRRSHGR